MLKRVTQAPIKYRLPAMIVGALMCFIIGMSTFSYLDFKRGTETHAEKLSETTALQSIKTVQAWFNELIEETDALANDRTSQEFLERLNRTTSPSSGPTMEMARTQYIDNNPYPLGQREKFQPPQDGTVYNSIHAEYHGQFRGVTDRSNYYDLFFISPKGDVVYSVFKEDDFGTNVLGGRYASSGLGQAFQEAIASPSAGVVFSDFAPYAPSANGPASFLAEAVKNRAGAVIGVVAIQIPYSALSERLQDAAVLGAHDELYILGADGLARTQSIEPNLLSVLDKPPVLEHLGTSRDVKTAHFVDVVGIRGNKVDAHVNKFDVLGSSWKIVVERDYKQAIAPLIKFAWLTLLIVAIATVLAVAVGVFLARSVTRPLSAFAESMKNVADGDLNTDIDTLSRSDEFGQIASDLDAFREKLRDAAVSSAREAQKTEEQSKVVRVLSDGLDQLANGNLTESLDAPFDQEYEELRENFNATLKTMNELMQTIVENSNEIHARAEEISASSDDLSHRTENQAATLEETAAALDELTASVREAAESASEVENVVTEARQDAEQSGVIVSEAVSAMSLIRKSSSEISQIIGVIDDIAFQTNLLSLNAGVEAARAGEAGRGFAVVASEVRALAQRSSEAAKQIKSLITSSSEQVETGVGLVGRTGEALDSIIERVSNIDTLVSGIASGSREQSSGLGEINIGMSQLDQVTQQNAAMVEEATAAASTLRNEASGLTHVVGRFRLKNSVSSPTNVDSVIDFTPSSIPHLEELDQQPLQETVPPKKSVNTGGWTDF